MTDTRGYPGCPRERTMTAEALTRALLEDANACSDQPCGDHDLPIETAADLLATIATLRVAGDALASHLRVWCAPSAGTHICTCRGTGINPPRCWYCDARDLYLAWDGVKSDG